MGKSARSFRASSLVFAVTATRPSYPGARSVLRAEANFGPGGSGPGQGDPKRAGEAVCLAEPEPRTFRLRRPLQEHRRRRKWRGHLPLRRKTKEQATEWP